MPDERRCDRQPGLFKVAQNICIYDKTDGFCTPQNKDACKCWDIASAAVEATGMSCRAVAWIFHNKQKIEELAKESDHA